MRTLLAVLAICATARAQELEWRTSIDEARKTKKPIVYLRLLGDLKGKL